ncbi:MAG: hypothetical protein ABSF23_08680 [Terracidiphilus sp.]|jgi:hypothetical protein
MSNAPDRQNEKVSGQEILDLFRKAIRGEVKIVALGRSWNDVYAGDVRFRIGDYEVVIFNDCNELDYADSVTAPDGRAGDFDDWWDTDTEPVRLLTEPEYTALEHLLESAPVEDRTPSS